MAKSKPALVKRAVAAPVPEGHIEAGILLIRGHKVLLDEQLASLYRMTVKRLNEAVKRNRSRFPADFMFQLSKQEFDNLRSQFATSSSYGGRRYPPFAFTEHGAVMLASVLNSPVAVEASIQVVRAFVRLRQLLASDAGLRRKLDRLERKMKDHDEKFAVVFEAIRQLMDESDEDADRPRIGYETEGQQGG